MESLHLRRWYIKLSCFNKLFNSEYPHHLFKLILSKSSGYVTRSMHNISFFKASHIFSKNLFFPSTIIKWNKLDHDIRNSSSFHIFRKSILKFIGPTANSLSNRHNLKGIKFIIWLLLSNKSKQDSLDPLCNCGLDIESTTRYLLHDPIYITERCTHLSTIENIDNNLSTCFDKNSSFWQ